MLRDWELWACANQLVEQHGRGAITNAGEPILAMVAEGDQEGHANWLAILSRINQLLRDTPHAGERLQWRRAMSAFDSQDTFSGSRIMSQRRCRMSAKPLKGFPQPL